MRRRGRLRERVERLRPPRRGHVILSYHRIADVELDPSGLSVSPARFKAHMAMLAERAVPSPLARLARGDTADARAAVTVTFDDGYVDNLSVARPILERFGVPATVFIPSGAVGRAGGYWWDTLETVVFGAASLPDSLDVEIGGRRLAARVRDDGGERDRSGRYRGWRVWRGPARTPRQRLYTRLWEALLVVPDPERRSALRELSSWAGTVLPIATHSTLDARGIRELIEGGLIELGAHTVTHATLPELPPEAQRAEIVDGRGRLEELVGAPVAAFSYPYGAYTDETVGLVRDAGFECAVTTLPGAVTPGMDPHRLPRLSIGDWAPRAFARRVGRYLRRPGTPDGD